MSIEQITYERIGNTWVFSDGTVLPVVSGGDETAGTPGGGGSSGQPAGGGEPGGGAPAGNPPAGGDTGQGSGQSEYSPYGSGFLGRLPAEARAQLEPYVKQWDAGVTRQFQELQSQLNPYRELGDLEQVKAAVDIIAQLEDNPWAFYGRLQQHLQAGELGPAPQGFGQQQAPVAPQPTPPPADQGLTGDIPEPIAQRFSAMENILTLMAQHLLGQNQQTQQQAEDDALAQELSGLHEAYGDFDEDWVMARHMADPSKSLDELAQGWGELINSAVAQRNGGMPQNSLPVILGGGAGGVMPSGTTDPRQLSRQQTQSLVAEVLQRSQAARQG